MTGTPEQVPLLLLCGAPGTGKSSLAWEVYSTLLRAGVAVATVDLDVVGYGPPPCSSGSFEMKLTNLASVWANYEAAGARCLVVSGVSASSADVTRCRLAVPRAVSTVCVLTVDESEQRKRLARRASQQYSLGHGGASTTMTVESQAEFAAVAARELAASTPLPGALVIGTTGKTVPSIAHEILDATTWPSGR